MKYYAHTIDNKDESKWHLLSSHLRGTAEIAASFANSVEFSQIFKIAGYLHDLGKYQPAFQKYLKEGGRRGSVPHASWGAGYSLRLKNQELAFAIDGHHKGLPDRAEAQEDMAPYRKCNEPLFDEIVEEFYNDLKISHDELIISSLTFNTQLEREIFIRYLFSALTDADWLDTERACTPDLSNRRKHLSLDYENLLYKLEIKISEKPKTGEINKLRNEVRQYALSKCNMHVGFYSMNLPTGLGKTLASFSWALEHARYHHLKRIIIVLPFVNIIDQTAQVLKSIFGDEYILEHHSATSEDISIDEDVSGKQYGKRLACENWDYPIIITTTVQFFESLFSHKPSKCRKVHNIADSVVIFDEVQSLPKEIIIPTLTMLRDIHSVMNTSFLFCTATLPAFEKREGFDGITEIASLVEKPTEVFDKTRRVEYHAVDDFEPIDFDDLLSLAEKEQSSILAVFNTKKAAREFFSLSIRHNFWENHYHLSTGMCAAHRISVIKEIRNNLSEKRKISVSSTQLIEAGVDFDFPCVFREMAPLESIIQSAGRCNREGLMENKGRVYLFTLRNASMPDKQYKTAAGFAMDLIKDDLGRLYDHSFYPDYYRKVLGLFVDGDVRGINDSREKFNFKTVSGTYRIIDKVTRGLFIHGYDDNGGKLLRSIRKKEYLSREDHRLLQVYMVQVYDSFIIKNSSYIEVLQNDISVWHGDYDNKYGISVGPVHSDDYVV